MCASVCPRGVLKLENGEEAGRINDKPITIGNNNITVNL
jgi:NAD-dependent dihydropyrimidine dehydrogenase PreA subunit